MTKADTDLWMAVIEGFGWVLGSSVVYATISRVGNSPAVQVATIVIAIVSALLLRRGGRVLLRWVDNARNDGVSSLTGPFCAILVYISLVIAMWGYGFLFFNQIAQPGEAPFCSGSEPIDPEKFGLMEALYFTVISFATVGYGDIYACTAFSRWAVTAELSTTITIGILTLSALVSLMIELGRTALTPKGSPATDHTVFIVMAIILFSEPVIFSFLTATFPSGSILLKFYAGISAVLAVGMAVGALVEGTTRMSGVQQEIGNKARNRHPIGATRICLVCGRFWVSLSASRWSGGFWLLAAR